LAEGVTGRTKKMDYATRIRGIRTEIAGVRDEHYAKHNFKPVKKAYQSRRKRESDSNYHLKQLCKHLKLKGPEVFDQRDIDIINDDIFHKPGEEGEKERVVWKDIDNEARVEYVENFLSCAEFNPPVSDDIKQQLVDLLQDGKLLRKSDIVFDEVNAVVTKICVMKYDEETDSYYLNLKQQEERNKRSKRLKKLFRQ